MNIKVLKPIFLIMLFVIKNKVMETTFFGKNSAILYQYEDCIVFAEKQKVVPQELLKLSRHGGSLSLSPRTLSLSSTEAKNATGKVCTKCANFIHIIKALCSLKVF